MPSGTICSLLPVKKRTSRGIVRVLNGGGRGTPASGVRLYGLPSGAARRQSPAGVYLFLAERGLVELCVSEDILREVAEVLSRPRVRAKFPSLTDAVIEEFMRAL